MSANNQTLIKKHGDKYLVFDNIQAESWDEVNKIMEEEASLICDTLKDAIIGAKWLEHIDSTEYGIVEEVLYKDGAKVIII